MSQFFKTKIEQERVFVWDPVRKKHIVLTPEEIVRQQMLSYMVENKNYPISLISVEKQIYVNGLQRRYDIVVYKDDKPWLLVECKSNDVEIKQKVVEQAAYYNIHLNVPYLVITNGQKHFVAFVDKSELKYDFLKDLPEYYASNPI